MQPCEGHQRMETRRIPIVAFLTCFLLLAAGGVAGEAGAWGDDLITRAECRALVRQEASPVISADSPPTAAGMAPAASPPAGMAVLARYGDWLSHGNWYLVALLGLVGMLISSLLAQRLSRERDAARVASRSKSDFLANISHEIRTPMNAILGFTQILKEQVEDEKQQQYINAINVSGNTLLRLINDLLDLAKFEAGKFELQPTAVALKGVAMEIQNIFLQVVADKRLDFIVELDPNLPEAVFIDEVRLRQILFNLLKNAVKFTDQGKISLSMRVRSVSADNHLELEIIVADTGIGIPEEEQATIFDAFTQRKSQDQAKYAGTGLGLGIARRLVEMIGGELTLVSEVGRGSTFTALLRDIPLAASTALRPRRERPGSRAIRFQHETVVLIIDAIDSNCMIFREFLRPTKVSVLETVSVEAGIDWCMAIKPDVIILDYTMSNLRDPLLVQRFNRVKEEMNIPVVVVTTASAAVGSEEFHTDFHFDAWLQKPVRLEEFNEVLARFLPHTTLFKQEGDLKLDNYRRAFVLPDAAQVARAVSGLGERRAELRRILVDNMLVQYEENRETFIINEIKSFAEEVGKLASEFELDFLGRWAEELVGQASTFDMERLPRTFELFPELLALIEGGYAGTSTSTPHPRLNS
jgi:two-component system, NarL family, sensor histidine kinase EvgS